MYAHTTNEFSPKHSIVLDVRSVAEYFFLCIFWFVLTVWTLSESGLNVLLLLFGPDQKNQENRSTSVNTPFCCSGYSVLSETLHLPQLDLYRSAKSNSCMLYCTATACLTCSQQRVLYVLAQQKVPYLLCSSSNNQQQQRSRSIPPRPNISILSYPLPCKTLVKWYNISLN